jgi:hypothetical protein
MSSTISIDTTTTTSSTNGSFPALPIGCLDAFRATVLATHNQYRKLCDAPALTESSSINNLAQTWVAQVTNANGNISSYGVNLFGQFYAPVLANAEQCSILAQSCVNTWYSEISVYYLNYLNMSSYSDLTKHYTQLVWKNTSMIGMGLSWSIVNDINYYTVMALYYPKGNIDGQFEFNVKPPITTSTSTTSTTTTTTTKVKSAVLSYKNYNSLYLLFYSFSISIFFYF